MTAVFWSCNKDEEITRPAESADGDTQCVVYEFCPAPGQFINEGYEAHTAKQARQYAEQTLNAERQTYLSLGGFGGYIVVGFGRSVVNSGEYDFEVIGNAFNNSSEPGVVYVMQDENANTLPDDRWFELRGSEYDNPESIADYEVTYLRPTGDYQPIEWYDNIGGSGQIERITKHQQPSYYPAWITDESYTLRGRRLPTNAYIDPNRPVDEGDYWVIENFEWGYADNAGSNGYKFRIADAVDEDGNAVNLRYIDFIKVQTAVNSSCGNLVGEISTEVCRFRDLHYNR